IAIAELGNKWIGTCYGGLAEFDGINWSVYDTTSSGLPSNVVCAIAIDELGNKWIGTGYGLAEFDGINWTVYDTTNSGLPDNWVEAIAIDGSGNKWIGTWGGGLAVYSGGTGIEEENDEKVEIGTMKVYSNPFTGIAQIRYSVPKDMNVNIAIYNLLGQKVATLVNGNKKAGYYTVTWDGSKLSAGIYFIKLKAGSFKQTEKIILMK
ncbi:T9SS type A sorting domain-containing protein, partial [candidate division WOR-3 bacterium]|nr:T9SS type A sorting domain-containing protein [candidate division WOR-3 bacterium]